MSDHPLPPYPGSYWVIPGSLLASGYPGASSDGIKQPVLDRLLDAGIRSVISLLEEEEVSAIEAGDHLLPYEDELEALGEQRGCLVEIANYAIETGSTPTDQEMQLILDAIDAEIEGRDNPTLVHCTDGHGRTGLVVGCYLARHGIANGKGVLDKIRELRAPYPDLAEHKSPENIVQERFVTRWKQDQ